MDKIKKLADYLERNKVDAILFAEALTLVRDKAVKQVLVKNIKSGHSIKDTLPWEKILSEIEEGLRDRIEVEQLTEKVQEERRKIGIK